MYIATTITAAIAVAVAVAAATASVAMTTSTILEAIVTIVTIKNVSASVRQ